MNQSKLIGSSDVSGFTSAGTGLHSDGAREIQDRSEVQSFDPEIKQLGGPRSLLFYLTFILCVFFLWAYLAELDEISRAEAVVVASSRTQVIQSQDGGILENLFVREGDRVVQGQVLAQIDRTRALASYGETRSQVAALSARTSRLEAELFGRQPEYEEDATEYPDFVKNQNKLLSIRTQGISDELAAIENIRALVVEELMLNQPLEISGEVSRVEILRLERQAADLAAQKIKKQNDYLQELQSELSKSKEELTATRELLAQRKHILDQTELKSPMDGEVKNVSITTLTGVIKPGEDIMEIVPSNDELIVEGKLSPTDIGFVTVGMPVDIKINAFDPSIYGSLPGELVYISADAISEDLKQNELPYFRIQVKAISRQFSGRPNMRLDLQPGMTATAEIKTGRRTVLEYLTKPVLKTMSNSLRER